MLQRKEKENSSLKGKIEDEHTLGGKLNTQIKELQARLEEVGTVRTGQIGIFFCPLDVEVQMIY